MTVPRFSPGLSGPNRRSARSTSLIQIVRSPQFQWVLGFIAFEIAYYFAFSFGRSFGPLLASPFWLPDSVLLCALLKSRRELWWLFILGGLPIRLLADSAADIPLWLTFAVFGVDSVKMLSTAWILHRLMSNTVRFDTVRDITIFIAFAVVLIPAVAAFGGAAARQLAGADFWAAWMRWFMGDVLAQSVVTPIILYWVFGAPWKAQRLEGKRLREAALLIVGLLVASCWSFMDATAISDPSFYAPVPFLFWAAVRFGMLGATGGVAVITAFITYSALVETGPFANLSPTETAFALQTYLLVRSVPLYLLATSIEQRRTVESSLVESEQRFRTVADSAPVLLWMTGPDKLCTFVNQGWLKFTGRTLDQELGTGWIESLHPDDRQHCLEIWEAAFDAKEPFEVEHRIRRHDGEYRWTLVNGIPRFAENGEFLGYIGSVLDITDRKGVEESNRALAHVQRLAIMGELTAAVAHELRQPSAAIMSNAEAALVLLESGEAPADEVREIVTDIKHANVRANEVLGRIQDFLRKREIEMETIDLNTVVSDVLALVAADVRKRRMRIRAELGEDLPLVLGNRTQLQQVILNLIVNGMDAMSNTSDGRRQLSVVTRTDSDGLVELAVADSGSGIASGNMPRLFESFFTTRAEGMGLGLSIARSIVESHGGRIWAGNNPEGGATFHFTIRAANVLVDSPEPARERSREIRRR